MKPFRAVRPRMPAEMPAMDANDVRLKSENRIKTQRYCLYLYMMST